MKSKVSLDAIYVSSEEVVAREVQGEIIIIPIYSGIADTDDGLFSMNETGQAIWRKLDGKKILRKVVEELAEEFETPKEEIEKDILGIIEELIKRRMLVEQK